MQYHFVSLLCFFASLASGGVPDAKGLFRRGVQTLNNVATLDGVPLSMIPVKPSVKAVVSGAISESGWTATCDSSQAGNDCSMALDGNATTFWLSESSPDSTALPHSITIDMKSSHLVGSITIQPRQDGNNNGHIGQHTISLRYEL